MDKYKKIINIPVEFSIQSVIDSDLKKYFNIKHECEVKHIKWDRLSESFNIEIDIIIKMISEDGLSNVIEFKKPLIIESAGLAEDVKDITITENFGLDDIYNSSINISDLKDMSEDLLFGFCSLFITIDYDFL